MARTNEKYLATVGYVNDPRGAQQFVESSEQVQSALRRTETELGDLGPAAAGGVRRLSAEMDRGQNDIETLRRDVIDFREELERLDNVHVEPVIDVQQRGGATGGRNNEGIYNSVENFGERSAALLGGLNQSEAANAVGFVGDLGASLRTLSPIGIAATAAATGFGLVIADVSQKFEEARQHGLDYVQVFGETTDLIAAGATSGDIRASITEAEAAASARERTRDELQGLVEQFQAIPNDFSAASVDLREKLIERFTELTGITPDDFSIPAIQASIEQLTTQAEAFRTSVATSTAVLNSGAAAANDNAAAFDTLVNAGQGVLDLIQRNIDLSLEQAEATRREIVDKQKLIVVTEEAAEATRRAAQATAITEATTQLFDVRADLSEKTNDLAEKEAALAKVTADTTAKIAQLEADAGERRNEAIAKSNDDIEKQEQEHKDRIADIDRKANADIQNAIGRRDALAAFQAAQERKEQITDEVDSNRKRKQELQKSLDDQLNAIRTNLRKQTEAVRTNAANEETIKRQARDASRVALQNAQNAEVLLTKQFYTTQQNSLVTNYQQQLAIHEAGMIKIKDGIVRQYQDALQWGGGKTINTNSGNSSGKSFVTPYSPSQSGVSVVNNFNGSNLTPNQVQQIFTRSLTDAARRATYA